MNGPSNELSLRESYNTIERSSAELVKSKKQGADALKAQLLDNLGQPLEALAELVKFKFCRQGLFTNVTQKLGQETALANLEIICEASRLPYDSVVSLARNRSALFGLKAIPATLQKILRDLNDDQKAALASRITKQEIEFLARAGVTLPSVEKQGLADVRSDTLWHSGDLFVSTLRNRDDDSVVTSSSPFIVSPVHSTHGKEPVFQRSDLESETAKAATTLGFEKIQEGNYLQCGALFIFGQLHYVDKIEKSIDQTRTVKKSQRKIFDCLARLNIKKIYLEGVAEGDPQFGADAREKVKKIFASYDPKKKLSKGQGKCLLLGAALVYAALNEDVVLLPTSSKRTRDFIASDMVPPDFNDFSKQEPDDYDFNPLVSGWTKSQQKFLVGEREVEMTKYILDDLNGRDSAAFVVGMGHRFQSGFHDHEHERHPDVYRKDFG